MLERERGKVSERNKVDRNREMKVCVREREEKVCLCVSEREWGKCVCKKARY